MKDPYRYFRVEARELAADLAKSVLDLEAEGADRAAIEARLLRLSHTLKGAARVVGHAKIAELSHALEDAIAAPERAEVPLLLARVDAIAACVAELEAPRERGPSDEKEQPWSPRVDTTALDFTLEALSDATAAASAVRRAVVELRAGRVRGARDLDGALASLDAHLARAAARAHDLGLVPASSVFAQIERAARDTARELGKRIHFETRGGDHHLDGRVLALLRDALVLVVQNAVDHGIEDAAERARAGKPEIGTIWLEITRSGHIATLVCRDDGRGIDAAAVERAARQRGLRVEQAATRLIFEPGLSTRSDVSPISGRGVGLDAVRDIVVRLSGDVHVDSVPGLGAAFIITVPVSLSSMPVLGVVGGARASIPLEAVRSTMRLPEGAIQALGEREAVEHDGSAVPMLRLDAWLASPAPAAAPRVAVIIEAGGIAALGVERLLGVMHAVVLPIPTISGPLPLLGASIDPDGAPVPVLAPSAVVDAAKAARRPPASPEPARRRVLVIDDSMTSRMLEQSILASAGFETDVAASAEEALEKARATPYDLFVVDVEMEGMDGFQFVQRTKSDPGLSRVPSIIVSSRASDSDKRRGAECGARAWVVKGELAEESFLELARGLSR